LILLWATPSRCLFDPRHLGVLFSLNMVDKLPKPLVHLAEINRLAQISGAQFLFSDPFSWSKEVARGRDLLVEPMPAAGPINFLAYPVMEINGKPVRAAVDFSFTRSSQGR
jgi:hypothetical protein